MTPDPLCKHCGKPRFPTHGKTMGKCLSPNGKIWRTFEPADLPQTSAADQEAVCTIPLLTSPNPPTPTK